jgi:hypothetical protein
MSDTNKLSSADIEKILAPKIAELTQQTQYGEYPDPSTVPIRYLQIVGTKRPIGAGARQPLDKPLLRDQVLMLQDILHFPEDGVGERSARFGIGYQKADKLLDELQAAGCIQVRLQKSLSLKGGRPKKTALLTPFGSDVIRLYDNHSHP